MKLLWFLLYNILFYPLVFGAYLTLAVFNSKAREGFISRFKSNSILKNYFNSLDQTSDVYWFHVASLGEFMQLLPILAKQKEIEPESIRLVSFFSPSGFKHCNSELVDLKIYLPFDFFWIINKAIRIAKPKKIVFVSYDIWPNLLWSARNKGVQTNIIAAVFTEGSNKLLQPIKSFYLSLFLSFDSVYTVSEPDKLVLNKILGHKHSVFIEALGNPRYDTVYTNDKKSFLKNNNKSRIKKIVLGSIHRQDDRNILGSVIDILKNDPKQKLICVPHETKKLTIERYQKIFSDNNIESTIFKGDSVEKIPEDRVVIVGVVGLLSKIYIRSSIAYIGGGFSSGIHNVMEPAAAGLPVIFGPNYSKFNEAKLLIESGGGFSVSNGSIFKKVCTELLTDSEKYNKARAAAFKVIENNTGASEKIVSALFYDQKKTI